MLSNTVKEPSANPIPGRHQVDDDIPQKNSESSALTSEINYAGNSTQTFPVQETASTRLTDGFLTRVWRCLQGNINNEEGTELTEILTQGETLRRQAHSLSAPSNEAPVPQGWKGSLLKRCLVGAGLLTGSGVLGGAGYAGYKHYGAGAAPSGKSPQSEPLYTPSEAVKIYDNYNGSLEGSFNHYALHHDDSTNRSRHHRRHLPASAYNTTEYNVNNDRWKNNSRSALERANHRVIKQLYREGLLLNKKLKYKEKMLSSVSQYLHYGENIHAENEDKIKLLAQKILSGRGIYGENKKETLSRQQAKSVVRYWVFQNIIGTTPEKYIESKIKSDISRSYTVDDIQRLLPIDTLPDVSHFRPYRLVQSEQSSLRIMWKIFLLEDMPFLALSDKQVKSISLNDYDFASLYSGSRFIKNIQGEEFSSDEIISVGESIWNLAIIEGISEDKLAYYRAPAIFFYATSSKEEKNGSADDIDMINNYLNYRSEINTVEKNINEKYNIYLSAVTSWLTKGRLADKIIEECPDLNSDIVNTVSIKRVAKQNYLDAFMKPCNSAPESLDTAYTQLTTHVADSFSKIDKYLILPALNTLPTDEQTFISSPKSIIHLGKVLINSSYISRLIQNGNTNKEINVPLNNTVIFSVQQSKQERIYALKQTQNNQEYYKLIRVDRNLNDYLKNDIFDNDFIHKTNPPWFFPGDLKYIYYMFFYIDRYTFNEVFKINKELIETEHSNNESLIDSLCDSHRMTLFNDLYKFGNEYSDLQKVWHVVKHIIPFYDCTNSIIEKNIVASSFECTLDAISLIPLLGQAAKLSVKFGTGLTLGLHKGMATLGKQGIKVAGKNILREVSLPTTVELASLGKETLRFLDPGVEIMTSITSRKFGEKIVKLISRNKKSAGLVKNLELRIAHLPQTASDTQVIGILPGATLEVPVTAIGKQKGKNIYVKVNPETGEKFGTKYFCLQNGMLTPFSSLPTTILMRNKRSDENIYNNDLNRVKRTGNNPNLCSEQPSTSRTSQTNVNPYNKITNINSIALQMKFLPPPIFSAPIKKFITKGSKRIPIEQPHLSYDFSSMSKNIRKVIWQTYNKDSISLYHFNQNIETIPRKFTQLRDNIPEYRESILLAKKLIDDLDNQFQLIDKQQTGNQLQSNINLLQIENYLSRVLKLDTITDTSITALIKKESISRLKHHVRNMKNYFNDEINNIYFASANINPRDYINKHRKLFSFVFKTDTDRRVIIMADYFTPADISTKLHSTILHEVSHFSGTYDFYVNGHRDITNSIKNFNDAALGVNNQYIVFEKTFIKHYQSSTHLSANQKQLNEIIKRDPVLRANVFIENADFLADIIADLATLTHHNDGDLSLFDTKHLT